MHNCRIFSGDQPRALTSMFFTFQNKTKSAAVRQAGRSQSRVISCDFLLTKIECLMMFDAICFARIPHLPLWSSEHSLISAKPQALRTGTATYRATGRPNANTRLTLIDTFLQYRQMHYQEIRCSWNCFIWKLSVDSLCVSLVCRSLFVFVSHLFPYDWAYSNVFNVFLKQDFCWVNVGWSYVFSHKGALARWFSLHSKFAVRFVGKGPGWNSADLSWEVQNYPIPAVVLQDACLFLFYYVLYRSANMGLAGALLKP